MAQLAKAVKELLDNLVLRKKEPERDVRWHGWRDSKMTHKGDYLAVVVVEEPDDTGYVAYIAYTFYVYWDGVSDYVTDNNRCDVTYSMHDILEWAYDGDDV